MFGQSRALRTTTSRCMRGWPRSVIALVFLYPSPRSSSSVANQRGDHQVAASARRVASSSAVAEARGDTGLSRKASWAARDGKCPTAAGHADDRRIAPNGRNESAIRCMASTPSMPDVHQHRLQGACSIRSAAACLLRPMNSADGRAAQDRVEHAPGRTIIFDAEDTKWRDWHERVAVAAPDRRCVRRSAVSSRTVRVSNAQASRRDPRRRRPSCGASCLTEDRPKPRAAEGAQEIQASALENGRKRR